MNKILPSFEYVQELSTEQGTEAIHVPQNMWNCKLITRIQECRRTTTMKSLKSPLVGEKNHQPYGWLYRDTGSAKSQGPQHNTIQIDPTASPRGGRKIPPNNPEATNLENSDAGRKGSKEQLRKGKLGNHLKGWSEDRVERAERGYVKAIKSGDPQGQAEEEKRPEKAERGPDK